MITEKLEELRKFENVRNDLIGLEIDSETEYRLKLVRIAIRSVFKNLFNE